MKLTRRSVLAGAAIAAAMPAVACSRETAKPKSGPVPMTVHKDPNCPCCEGWVKHAAAAGFAVKVIAEPDMNAVKRRLGVPETLWSCHTSEAAGLVFEGTFRSMT